MLTSDDIKYMAHSGEGYNVEFKGSVPAKVRELAEEICAFANSAGGYLLIGVNDRKLPAPDFGLKGMFDITLKRPAPFGSENETVSLELSEIQSKVFDLLRNNESITTDEISKTLSISTRYVMTIIKRLKDLEYIEREGSDKKGIWKVKIE